jgi:hypothetical protein
LIDINDDHSRQFRIAKLVSTFTVEALGIGKTLEGKGKVVPMLN